LNGYVQRIGTEHDRVKGSQKPVTITFTLQGIIKSIVVQPFTCGNRIGIICKRKASPGAEHHQDQQTPTSAGTTVFMHHQKPDKTILSIFLLVWMIYTTAYCLSTRHLLTLVLPEAVFSLQK